MTSRYSLARRHFLKIVGAAPAAGVAPALAAGADIALIVDAADAVVNAEPVGWAIGKLKAAVVHQGGTLRTVSSVDAAKSAATLIIVAGPKSSLAAGFPAPAPGWESPDALRLVPGRPGNVPAILVSANDIRGFVYGLLELAERVDFGGAVALHLDRTVEEKSPNRVRSIMRSFCDDREDKRWYYDKACWSEYLDALVAARFNRFQMAYGFAYNTPINVTGDYLHFPYPYLLDVPGYDVKITPALEPGERERNMDILRFVARETGRRGMQFQLGIWTHAFAWTNSPRSEHVISGLTPQPHSLSDGPYCHDALAMLLKECPEITGVSMRVHSESGIPEGSYDFWQHVFDAIAKCGRQVEIDMHAKNVDATQIAMAAKTGQPIKLGAKYSSEHQGLGYHQADIRSVEIDAMKHLGNEINANRRFSRYGYADFFQEGSPYEVLFRMWPGTQNHLLSADPALASALGRTASFCNAAGLEICEPLTFKGRNASGHAGARRNAYLKAGLEPKWDWQKHADSYRLWGRLLYNPDASPEAWRRSLSRKFGAAAPAAETAIANASRVLPLLTTAHLPSASNRAFWYEMYCNQPIVEGNLYEPYGDTPSPKIFGNVAPLDFQLFSPIAEHVGDLMAGRANPKYSPAEVAVWLDALAQASEHGLDEARKKGANSVEFQRLEEDALIQAGIARFFAAKMRSAMYFTIWRKSGNAQAAGRALSEYLGARAAWAKMAERAKAIYVADISDGDIMALRGHWIDRLPAIDLDIAAMREALTSSGTEKLDGAERALPLVARPAPRGMADCRHTPPMTFSPGTDLPVSVTVRGTDGATPTLFYRHVNQGERWRSMPMKADGNNFSAAIPGDYTKSVYPMQYYFVLSRADQSWFHPAFNATLSNQPYYEVWKRA